MSLVDGMTRHSGTQFLDQRPGVLANLPPGTRAVVARVVAPSAPAIARRLADLGFTPGTEVEVVRQAPLRDPVVYRIKDYDVCLRRALAACVQTVAAQR